MTIAAIVLGVLALAAIFVVEWLKKPRFKIMLLEPSTTPPPGKCRFLRLAVRNLDLPKLITKFVNRNTGDSCAAELVIYDKDGRRLKSSPVIW